MFSLEYCLELILKKLNESVLSRCVDIIEHVHLIGRILGILLKRVLSDTRR